MLNHKIMLTVIRIFIAVVVMSVFADSRPLQNLIGNLFLHWFSLLCVNNQLIEPISLGIGKNNVDAVEGREEDFIPNKVHKWTNATIPYELDNNLCKYFLFIPLKFHRV